MTFDIWTIISKVLAKKPIIIWRKTTKTTFDEVRYFLLGFSA